MSKRYNSGNHRFPSAWLNGVAASSLLMMSVSSVLANASLTTLYTFDGTHGKHPMGVSLDRNGNLVGPAGGDNETYYGVSFELNLNTFAVSTLTTFDDENQTPSSSLAVDSANNKYGTTFRGGTNGSGTLYKIAAGTNARTTLINFGGAYGQNPQAVPTIDSVGNVYGSTGFGGTGGLGTVYKYDTSGVATTVANFSAPDHILAFSNVVFDATGNLYGTTLHGNNGPGSIYKIDAVTHTVSTLHNFVSGDANSEHPFGAIHITASGVIYGTTNGDGTVSKGSVFTFDTNTSAFNTVALFTGANGATPRDGVLVDSVGNIFGVTDLGGANDLGTIFKIASGSNTITTLYSFSGSDGARPGFGLVADANGILYGTAALGGSTGLGTVFKLENVGYGILPEPASLITIGSAAVLLLRRRR